MGAPSVGEPACASGVDRLASIPTPEGRRCKRGARRCTDGVSAAAARRPTGGHGPSAAQAGRRAAAPRGAKSIDSGASQARRERAGRSRPARRGHRSRRTCRRARVTTRICRRRGAGSRAEDGHVRAEGEPDAGLRERARHVARGHDARVARAARNPRRSTSAKARPRAERLPRRARRSRAASTRLLTR